MGYFFDTDLTDHRVGDHRQWTEGGTSITNFGNHQLELYKTAIELYHESVGVEILAIRDKAYALDGSYLKGDSCLYYMNRLALENRKESLSPFWRIFDELRKGNSEEEAKLKS